MAEFEQPLAVLSACHRRIEDRCAALRRLANGGADSAARVAATSLMRDFDAVVRQHHADEEADLFPALFEALAGSDPVCVRELTQHLAAEHRELDARWRRVRAQLDRFIHGEGDAIAAGDVDALSALYEQHMRREERELLPMAARLLSDADLERVGHAMRTRRGSA